MGLGWVGLSFHLHVVRHVLDAESCTASLLGGGGHQYSRGDGKIPVRLLEALLVTETHNKKLIDK